MSKLATRLERLISRDVGRNISALSAAAAGGLAEAAKALDTARSATLITGFYVPAAQRPAAETDGPIGTAFLARSLVERGIPVCILTDAPCAPVVEAALRAHGLKTLVTVDVVRVEGFGGGESIGPIYARHTAAPVSHVVSIERCGPGRSGVPRNARGDDITAHTAPLERFFTPPPYRIGIGDGGNELGMGTLPHALIATHVRHGAEVACRVPADALIVAGVSNWGAAALALLVGGKAAALHVDGAAHDRLLDAICRAGAVDGITRAPVPTVDAVDAATHRAVVDALVLDLER